KRQPPVRRDKGSARVSRAASAPSHRDLIQASSYRRHNVLERLFRHAAETARETRALPETARDIFAGCSHNRRVSTLAERYAQMRDTTRVHERALFTSPRIPSELEVQARWFAGDFGKEFASTNGDKIDIIQFGVWNREAGPDFRDAAIRIN